MKKTLLAITALAVLVVGVSVPVWAADTITQQSTAGSLSFGFAPGTADLATFTHRSSTTTGTPFGAAGVADSLVCGGSLALGFTCSASNYIPRQGNDGGGANTNLPGAYTSSPNRLVSARPDWGCGAGNGGAGITTGACDDDGVSNIADFVLGNEFPADGFNTAPGAGLNNDVTTCGIPSVTCTDGQMTGTMTSVVNLNTFIGEEGMPSGSITFTRTPNASTLCGAGSGQGTLACFDTTLNQNFSQVITGLYTFAHTDVTLAPMDSVASRHYNSTDGATIVAGNGVLFMPSVMILSNTSVQQETMGGDPLEDTGGIESHSWGTLWTNNGGHPGGGQLFAPGSHVGNWAGDNAAALGSSADGNGFR
jgi:hypothetical protein